MNEIICPCCNAGSPDAAKYCANCGQPIVCKACGAGILPNARACIQCGMLIPERQNVSSQFTSERVVPPGYNHLEVHHRTESSSYDMRFLFSNVIGEQQGPLISKVVELNAQEVAGKTRNTQKQDDVANLVGLSGQDVDAPQLLPLTEGKGTDGSALSWPMDVSSDPVQALMRIFHVSDNKLRLVVQDMKASTQQEYTLRLVHLVLYTYQEQLSTDRVSGNDVLEITDFAGLVRTNVNGYLGRDGQIARENGQWSLKLGGIEHARKTALEVVDPTLVGEWLPTGDIKATGGQGKKGHRKTDSQTLIDKMAPYIAHEATQALIASIPHEKIAAMDTIDKALVALYGLRKAGHSGELMPLEIERYMFAAFHVSANHESVRSALRSAISHKNTNVIHGGHGYHITPSGEKYVEGIKVQDNKWQQPLLSEQAEEPAPHEPPDTMEE